MQDFQSRGSYLRKSGPKPKKWGEGGGSYMRNSGPFLLYSIGFLAMGLQKLETALWLRDASPRYTSC